VNSWILWRPQPNCHSSSIKNLDNNYVVPKVHVVVVHESNMIASKQPVTIKCASRQYEDNFTTQNRGTSNDLYSLKNTKQFHRDNGETKIKFLLYHFCISKAFSPKNMRVLQKKAKVLTQQDGTESKCTILYRSMTVNELAPLQDGRPAAMAEDSGCPVQTFTPFPRTKIQAKHAQCSSFSLVPRGNHGHGEVAVQGRCHGTPPNL
jgi:hypothetical protein